MSPTNREVHFLGAALGFGGKSPGAELGPAAIRMAWLLEELQAQGISAKDCGDVVAALPDTKIGHPLSRHPLALRKPAKEEGVPLAHFLPEVTAFCSELRDGVAKILRGGALPLVVGGDHAIAPGTVAGVSSHYHEKGQKIGMIWFDAHADINTADSTESGDVHGMPVAACVGGSLVPPKDPLHQLTRLSKRVPMVDPANAVLVGIRDVDKREKENLKDWNVRAFSMREIDMYGIHRVMEEALAIATNGTAGFHVSFDMDGCDAAVAPGTGTPVRGGPSFRESHFVLEQVFGSGKMLSLEIAEINPLLDRENATAHLAVELVLSALGRRIVYDQPELD